MTEEIKLKREALKNLSKQVLQIAKAEGTDPDENTVNSLIMKYAYNPEAEFDFKSFAAWKREGYTVKKGSKAYILWGQPVKINKEQEQNLTEEEKDQFFPLAYLFRSDQVVKPIRTAKEIEPTEEPQTVAEDLPF